MFATLFVIGSFAFSILATVVTILIGLRVRAKRFKNIDNNALKVTVIDETPIIKRQAENTGYTVSYGRGISSHEHYRYRNVITGYIVTFKVEWCNGREEIIKCKKDDAFYKYLIVKT